MWRTSSCAVANRISIAIKRFWHKGSAQLDKKILSMAECKNSEVVPIVYPAADKNKNAILNTLKTVLPPNASEILEIASGTGQHVVHFAQGLPSITWQPTDIDPLNLSSISAYVSRLDLQSNVRQPLFLDVLEPAAKWPGEIAAKAGTWNAILCSNLTHISPWACTLGLFSCAEQLLARGDGLLLIYGPYAVNGKLVPESNVKFDEYLKCQNPEWGVRDINDLIQVGIAKGVKFEKCIEMPANNKFLVFKKES